MAKGKADGGLYKLNGEVQSQVSHNIVQYDDSASTRHAYVFSALWLDIWHNKFTYPCKDVLAKMIQLSLISYIGIESNKLYVPCDMYKWKKLSFNHKHILYDHLFELLHVDMWTFPIISGIGVKYFMLMIDDSIKLM